MRKSTLVLLGVLVGQLIMLPTLYLLYKTPIIKTEFVDVRDRFYTTTQEHTIVIKNVSSWIPWQKKDLYIHIMPQIEVINEYKRRHGKVKLGLLGFYDPALKNFNRHEIYTVNSVSVVIHEMRHVFEKFFHRNLDYIVEGKPGICGSHL